MSDPRHEQIVAALQRTIGGCREDALDGGKCWAPAEYVIWGKLAATNALGPRCYRHAAAHVGHRALASRSGWALIHIGDLASDVLATTGDGADA